MTLRKYFLVTVASLLGWSPLSLAESKASLCQVFLKNHSRTYQGGNEVPADSVFLLTDEGVLMPNRPGDFKKDPDGKKYWEGKWTHTESHGQKEGLVKIYVDAKNRITTLQEMTPLKVGAGTEKLGVQNTQWTQYDFVYIGKDKGTCIPQREAVYEKGEVILTVYELEKCRNITDAWCSGPQVQKTIEMANKLVGRKSIEYKDKDMKVRAAQ